MKTKLIDASRLTDYLQGTVFCGLMQGSARELGNGPVFSTTSPVDGDTVADFGSPDTAQVNALVEKSMQAFVQWRTIPAPKRGELIRVVGLLARERKAHLADLITLEAGKIRQEALGEVQELIDICDFAVGLSRQLYGLTIASERPSHRMMEQWHPLGPVAIITAFNFPMAVWAWNAALAIVCGNPVIWKPSEQTPLCAIACHQLIVDAIAAVGYGPEALSTVILGTSTPAEALVNHPHTALVSATGSCRMGKIVAQQTAQRLGRYLLELGGNNAMIVAPTARLDLALRAIVFSAVGTTGQRCTSLRRVIAHTSIIDRLAASIESAYQSLRIGNPFDEQTQVGPIVSEAAFVRMQQAITQAQDEGGTVLTGGVKVEISDSNHGCYVQPAIVRISAGASIIKQETFAPLLYLISYDSLDEAIRIQNDVPQGLSSAIFTQDLVEAEQFLSAVGSDCGIANVNIGTSGAEIGGAFGGEKETGGGRESGSDAWKNYMRRATNTINYAHDLPLAQGIKFDI
jgi:aldehyde dehydrogenase (NAD+)